MNGNSQISANEITIKTSDAFKGGISSVVWNNKEFVYANGVGSGVFSASHFDFLFPDDRAEYFFPIEQKGELTSLTASGNQLITFNRLGFLEPVRGNTLSSHIHAKKVTIGFSDKPRIIEYIVTQKITEPHHTGVFEELDWTMPAEFNMFWVFDVVGRTFHSVEQTGQGYVLPIALSTQDGNYAIGCFLPQINENFRNVILDYRTDTPPWVVFCPTCRYTGLNGLSANRDTYIFKNYICVGTLEEVREYLSFLTDYFIANPVNPSIISGTPIQMQSGFYNNW